MFEPHAGNGPGAEELLKLAAGRLGTTPEALKSAASGGDLSQMTSGLDESRAAALKKVLSDPEEAGKLLSTPQARALFKLFQGPSSGKKDP